MKDESSTQVPQQVLHKTDVSGSVCNGCEFDKKCNMQDNGRYKEICSHFKQTDRQLLANLNEYKPINKINNGN